MWVMRVMNLPTAERPVRAGISHEFPPIAGVSQLTNGEVCSFVGCISCLHIAKSLLHTFESLQAAPSRCATISSLPADQLDAKHAAWLQLRGRVGDEEEDLCRACSCEIPATWL